MANDYLAYQFSGPVIQAVADGFLHAKRPSPDTGQSWIDLVNYWANLSITTAQDVDGTLNFVGSLAGFSRPLVSNLFFFTSIFLFTDAALPPVTGAFLNGLSDAQYIANGDCESATNDPLLATDTGSAAYKINCTLQRDATHVHGGSFARKMTVTATGSDAYFDFSSVDTGMNGLTAGETYSMSFWLYCPSGFTGFAPATQLSFYIDDGLTGSLVAFAVNTLDAYQQVTVQGVLAAGATKAVPRLKIAAGATVAPSVWVDDIVFGCPVGGEFDDANPPTTNVMPSAWYQSLLPLMAQVKRQGLSLSTVDMLAEWANTNGGGTGYTISRDQYHNVLVAYTTFIDPRALSVVNMIATEIETLPLVVFEEP
jgi:hypothetical protein